MKVAVNRHPTLYCWKAKTLETNDDSYEWRTWPCLRTGNRDAKNGERSSGGEWAKGMFIATGAVPLLRWMIETARTEGEDIITSVMWMRGVVDWAYARKGAYWTRTKCTELYIWWNKPELSNDHMKRKQIKERKRRSGTQHQCMKKRKCLCSPIVVLTKAMDRTFCAYDSRVTDNECAVLLKIWTNLCYWHLCLPRRG